MEIVYRNCPGCHELFNTKTRKGVILPCSHTICELCIPKTSSYFCPVCQASNPISASDMKLDYSLSDILETEELWCSTERCQQLATEICFLHYHVLCEACKQTQHCLTNNFSTPGFDISGVLYHKLDKYCKALEKPPAGYQSIGVLPNTEKLRLLRSLFVVPTCAKCSQAAQTAYFYWMKGNTKYYCEACARLICAENPSSYNCFLPLTGSASTPVEILKTNIQETLKPISTAQVPLNSNLFQMLKDHLTTGTLYDLQKIVAEVLELQSNLINAWPAETRCPFCCITFPITMFLWLNCQGALHGICRRCAEKEMIRHQGLRQTHTVECPMDGLKYEYTEGKTFRSLP